LPKTTLSRWLSQDRLYAQTYIGFIGALIARVDLPYAFTPDKSKSLRWRIVNLLTSALTNIHRELDFFETTARKYDLQLDAPPAPRQDEYGEGLQFDAEPATKQYIDLFRAFGKDPSRSLLSGLVVLWATETCYFKAWSFAASFLGASGSSAGELNESGNDKGSNDLDGGALRNEFIPNWTSDEFKKFLDEIADVTDQLAEREDAASRKLDVYKAVWKHILEVETKFWPNIS
jgi:thiaminase